MKSRKKPVPVLRPLTPLRAQMQLKALNELYEDYAAISPEDRDRLRKEILARLVKQDG